MTNGNIYKIAFALIKGNKPMMAREILTRVGSEEAFFTLGERRLSSILGFEGKILADAYRGEVLEKARREIEFAAEHKIRSLYFDSDDFPQRLIECEDSPIALFAVGDANLNARHCVSIVGTRNATMYGIDFINKLVDELAERLDDLLIISGLATGCDIVAHKRALDRGVPTVAVVAHGLDTIYPASHRRYAAKMVQSRGAIVTEYPTNTRPIRPNFLQRNRIVAGLSDAVVVVESAKRGGALHTARLGLLYNRDVFALPGRTSDIYSAGCNALIRSNTAQLIESADDLIEAMQWTARPKEGDQKELFPTLSAEQQSIVDFVRKTGEAQINGLTAALGMPTGRLMALLVELEFNGVLMALPGSRYRLA